MSTQLWSFHAMPSEGVFDIRVGGDYVMTVEGAEPETLQSLIDFWNDAERSHRMAMKGLPSLPQDEIVMAQATRITEHTPLSIASAHAIILGMLCTIEALLHNDIPLVVTGALASSVDRLIAGYALVNAEATLDSDLEGPSDDAT